MSNLVCLQVVFFSILLGSKFCYSFIGVRRTVDIITRKIEFSMKKTSEWDDDSIQSVGMSEASLPTLDPALVAKLVKISSSFSQPVSGNIHPRIFRLSGGRLEYSCEHFSNKYCLVLHA